MPTTRTKNTKCSIPSCHEEAKLGHPLCGKHSAAQERLQENDKFLDKIRNATTLEELRECILQLAEK